MTNCEGCPECKVLFDKNGYHGSVPDSRSATCEGCPQRMMNCDAEQYEICRRYKFGKPSEPDYEPDYDPYYSGRP